MRKIIQLKLKIFAKLILRKYKPKVIGITGSVGKTSTKEAVLTVLTAKFNVRGSIKNYNNELGLPLTIIGAESPGRNIFKWIAVFLKACKLILKDDKNYPQILVLEMAADRPGDIRYLTKIAKPYIGIVTAIGSVHLEFFNDIKKLIKEKSQVVSALDSDGWAVLNIDDKNVSGMQKDTKGQVLTFGFNKKADVSADNLNFSFSASVPTAVGTTARQASDKKHVNNLQGLSFKVSYDGATIPVLLPNILGMGQVYAALAAVAAGVIYGMDLVEIADALKFFKSPKGRMNLVKGIKNVIIIDDTYNSSPESVKVALNVLQKIPLPKDAQRFAVLGDMLELGPVSEKSHQEIGRQVAELKINVLITVGELSKETAAAAEKVGMSKDRIFSFSTADDAKKFVQERIERGDLILVKGSQGMRMERIVKEIMAKPLKAGELLVRQDGRWK